MQLRLYQKENDGFIHLSLDPCPGSGHSGLSNTAGFRQRPGKRGSLPPERGMADNLLPAIQVPAAPLFNPASC